VSTLNVILTHQSRTAVENMLTHWNRIVPIENIAVAYGGPLETFESIEHPHKAFITSDRLRTTDHQRERQSYHPIFQAIAAQKLTDGHEHVHLTEFDHIPLQNNINELQETFLQNEGADVLGYAVRRVDRTNNPHYLTHVHEARFLDFIASISVRKDKRAIFSMLGFGTFWTKEAFLALANVDEPFPIYLEIFMPTVAHHLGFRLRSFPASSYVSSQATFSSPQVEKAIANGEWFVHPAKDQWTATTT